MRVTTEDIKLNTRNQLDQLAEPNLQVSNDITMTKHFVYDAYSMFAVPMSRRYVLFKSYWGLFSDLRELYIKLQISGLRRSLNFYLDIKDFLQDFMYTATFRELAEMDPLEATRIFLDLFRKDNTPPPPPMEQLTGAGGGSSSGDDSDQQQDGQGSSDAGSDQSDEQDEENDGDDQDENPQEMTDNDQQGTSGDLQNIPIDIQEAKEKILPVTDKFINSGIFDEDSGDLKEIFARGIGKDTKEVKLQNVGDLVKKINDRLDRTLAIFNVARKHEFLDEYNVGEEVDDSLTPDNDMTISQNKTIDDIKRALPMEYLYDDLIFTKKAMEKSLNIIQHQSKRKQKQALYILLDVSGSMMGVRSVFAAGVTTSLVRQAVDEGSTYFLRYFDDSPSALKKVTNRKEAVELIGDLVRAPFSGGGTNITKAVRTAIKDIKNEPVTFDKVDIMVITDGEDHFEVTTNELKGIKLHVTLLTHKEIFDDSLIEVSDSVTQITDEQIRKILAKS